MEEHKGTVNLIKAVGHDIALTFAYSMEDEPHAPLELYVDHACS